MLPPSIEAVSPASVALPDGPLSFLPTLPDPTPVAPPGQASPPPTSASPQDGPITVAPPIGDTSPPPVSPGGDDRRVKPPAGWVPDSSGPQVTPQSWEDFVRWLQDLDKYAKSLEDELKNKTDEQLAQMGDEIASKLANQSNYLLRKHVDALIRTGDLPEHYRGKVDAILDFAKTWQDPKEQLVFIRDLAAVVIGARGTGVGGVTLERMAEVARAGLQAKNAGGSVRDPSGVNRSFNTGGYKELLRGYVGDASTLISPEYQRRANQHVGGAAAFVAGFIPGVSTITDIYGAITGTDLFTGEQLGMADRVLGVVPFGKIAKVLKSADTDNLWRGIISPERAQHILYGNASINPQQIPGVGGHLYPGGPGKSAFPATWSENKILNNVADILTSDKTRWYAQTGPGGAASAAKLTSSGNPAVWVTDTVRDGIIIRVAYEPATGRVRTAFPATSPLPASILGKPIR